ncbi:MAG: MFS transporter [Phycisphaerales bacterium]
MVGGGETYFAAFVLTIGGKDLAGGLVSSVPLLAGAILQLSAPALARRMGSPRRWVMTCAAVQCFSFVPLVVGALMGGLPLWVAFTAISLYWAAALGAGPTWSTWVAAAFPARLRAVYFGQRNRLCQVVQLGGILVAGGVLALGESRGAAEGGSNGGGLLTAFAVILSLAGLSRLSSIGFLRRQDDVPPESAEEESRIGPAPLPALSVMRRITSGRELRLLTYMLVAQVTVQVAAPYFNPYMLRQLDLDKGQYLILVASLFASKSLFLPMHGEFARRHGARRLLVLSGLGIVGLSALWMVSPSLWYLVPLQWLNGFMWGAWELATFLMILETIPHRERTSVLTVFNLLNCAAMVFGSLVGAGLLEFLGKDRTAYLAVFAASSFLRLFSLPLLMMLGRERHRPSRAITVSATEAAIRGAPGSTGRAALPALSGPDPEERR